MPRIVSTLTLGFLVALTGCPGDDSSSTSAADTTAGTAGTAGTTEDSTTPTTTNSTVDTTVGPTTVDPDTTGSPGTTEDPPGTTTDEPDTTTDAETTGGADACAECVETQCADELAACSADAACSCFQECAEENPGQAGALACANTCEIPLPELLNANTVPGALVACTMANCPKCV